MESQQDAIYPIMANKDSKWTVEYRKQWNREYRARVKAGEHVPNKRVEDSKWNDRNFRRAYDVSRNSKLAELKQMEKVSFDEVKTSSGKRPNYNKLEKEELLKKWIEHIKEGKDVSHPYLELTLDYKPEHKRPYMRLINRRSWSCHTTIQSRATQRLWMFLTFQAVLLSESWWIRPSGLWETTDLATTMLTKTIVKILFWVFWERMVCLHLS